MTIVVTPAARNFPRGASPRRTPLHALSLAAPPARSVRVARSLRSLARFSSCRQLNRQCEPFVRRHAVTRVAFQLLGALADPSQPEAGPHCLFDGTLAI